MADVVAKTPCCAVPVKVASKPMQDRKCPRCRVWWRVDVALLYGARHAQQLQRKETQ